MDNQEKSRSRQEPVPLQDIASGPHGRHALAGDTPPMGDGLLTDVLPAVSEAARQVGGYRRLAEIAHQLDQKGDEQAAQPANCSNEQACSSF